MLVYFPNKTSMECFISEVKANEFIETKGGNLISVGVFESESDAEKWIGELHTEELWHVSFDNSILVDNKGKPLTI
jgi:hypothetical protein